MTYSIIGRCPDTGAFGAAIATSNLAVGARCVRLRHGVGAFLSQHRTDPRLGDVGLEALARGLGAVRAVAAAAAADGGAAWRQLGALDAGGASAAHHGAAIYSIHGHTTTVDALALGNILATPTVTAAMAEAFDTARGGLGQRLMRALEAGRDAGGEVNAPVRSAALRVTGPDGLDERDLRVDMAPEAVATLRALFDAHDPGVALQREHAVDPDAHPIDRALFEGSLSAIAAQGLEGRFPVARDTGRWRVGP